MKRENIIWSVVFVIAGLVLLGRMTLSSKGMGKVYTRTELRTFVAVDEQGKTFEPIPHEVGAKPSDPNAKLNWPRTLGLWFAAFLTLAVFSFLYRDNPFYRFAEAIFVGVSAAFAMVAGFWDGLYPKLIQNLMKIEWTSVGGIAQGWSALVPLALSGMLLWRLAPKGGWISRWPLAFIVGIYSGIRLISYLDADFVSQIRNTIVPLIVLNQAGAFDLWASVRNILLIVGVLSSLAYFYFSFEHKGWYGRVARVGVWYLMMTFGASFAYTVMGRIALLSARLEFLFDDWLWLIDPLQKRV